MAELTSMKYVTKTGRLPDNPGYAFFFLLVKHADLKKIYSTFSFQNKEYRSVGSTAVNCNFFLP